MADKNSKWKENVEGKFYVDNQCIACDACVVEAPNFFKMNKEDGHAFVFNQPKTDKEIENCLEALEGCPVDAIGSDNE
ncbi:MAG: hypothetical protein Fur0010_15270 [Bdellovibrio sp.]